MKSGHRLKDDIHMAPQLVCAFLLRIPTIIPDGESFLFSFAASAINFFTGLGRRSHQFGEGTGAFINFAKKCGVVLSLSEISLLIYHLADGPRTRLEERISHISDLDRVGPDRQG